MPSKCWIPGCRSNYCPRFKARVFSFPRDEKLKATWLKAIQRKDRVPSRASKSLKTKILNLKTEKISSIDQELYQDVHLAKRVKCKENVQIFISPSFQRPLNIMVVMRGGVMLKPFKYP